MFECVVNVSVGKDHVLTNECKRAAGPACVDVHSDPDHNRSVFSIAASPPGQVLNGAKALAKFASSRIDISAHLGAHPRLGAIDVVPFVSLDESRAIESVRSATEFGEWWSGFGVPVFFYGAASLDGRTLPDLRKGAFDTITPDLGPSDPHAQLGATCVGVRQPLVAINCNLNTEDISAARRVATAVRETNGGLTGVRALGFMLDSQARAQVSMNICDLTQTHADTACFVVRDLAQNEAVTVGDVELVGLVPRVEFEAWTNEFKEWSGLDESCVVENRVGLG